MTANWMDDLNAVIARAEAAIREARYGVSAFVPLAGELSLGFAKYEHRWQLIVCGQDHVLDQRPLKGQTLELRIAAVGRIQALVDELEKKSAERKGLVGQSIKLLEIWLNEYEAQVRRQPVVEHVDD